MTIIRPSKRHKKTCQDDELRNEPWHLNIRRNATATLVVIATLLLVACGSSDDSDSSGGFQKITDTSQVFEIADFTSAGFKASKQYDVESLPDALDAWLGFWGPSASDRTDFELRFYGSHEVAVRAGAPLADEATGDLFRERKDAQTWTVGQKDRWRAGSATGITTRDSGSGTGPRYADFVIFGNVVLLCEGADTGQSFDRCEGLIDALTVDSDA